MQIKYISRNEITDVQQKMIDVINETCFPESEEENILEEGHPHGAVELGKFLLFDGENIVGQVYVHKRLTEYDGQEYYIGGLGGLAVMPEYRGKGYARQLAEAAVKMSQDIGVDVASLYVGNENKEKTAYKLYESLGYVFLNREGYYLTSIGIEKTDNSIMILGLNNKELAEKILATNHKFHYGNQEGYW